MIFLIILAATLGSALCKCPSGYVQYSNSCYTFTLQTANWVEAKSYCKALGAELATIKSAAVHTFVVEHAQHLDEVAGHEMAGHLVEMGYYLDGTDQLQQGRWRWASTGELIDFTHWAPGEPNNNHIERCLMIYRQVGYAWNNIFCTQHLNFICERSVDEMNMVG